MLYCPVCMNMSLSICHNGVVDIIINGKQMDAGRFLFNTSKQDIRVRLGSLEKKMEEFFKWYSSFQNPDPITYVHLVSSDFKCEEGCTIPARTRLNVIGVLFERDQIVRILEKLSEKYSLKLTLEET